jgi:uncharacterized phage protein (TIGR01671 family)
MNNRFKFRAWNKLSNEMKDVISLNINYEFPDCSNVLLETNTFDAIKTHNNPINCSVGLKNVVIMQCTGLKDKNDKLIYEGDIVEDVLMNKFVVSFNKNYLSFLLTNIKNEQSMVFYPNINIEVIGNIYENKELLNE